MLREKRCVTKICDARTHSHRVRNANRKCVLLVASVSQKPEDNLQ